MDFVDDSLIDSRRFRTLTIVDQASKQSPGIEVGQSIGGAGIVEVAVLLGLELLHRHAIGGLHTDAITLVAEVIESKVKASRPWGKIAQATARWSASWRLPLLRK